MEVSLSRLSYFLCVQLSFWRQQKTLIFQMRRIKWVSSKVAAFFITFFQLQLNKETQLRNFILKEQWILASITFS